VVTIRDSAGNTVTASTAAVTVAIQSGTGGTLGGTTTVSAVNGVVTFSGLTLAGTVGTNYVLSFTAIGSDGADTGNMTVTPGAATQLALTTAPVASASGTALATQPVVAIKDAQGNTVTTSTVAVTVAIRSGTGGTLGGTKTVNAVAGVATFSGLTLTGTVGTNYVLRFTSTGLTQIDSGNICGDARWSDNTGADDGAGRRSVRSSVDYAAGGDDPRRTGKYGDVGDSGGDGGDPVGNGRNAGRNDDGQRGGGSRDLQRIDAGGQGRNKLCPALYGDGADAGGYRKPDGDGRSGDTARADDSSRWAERSGKALTTQPVVTIRDSAGNTVTTSTAAVTVAIQSGTGGTLGGTTDASMRWREWRRSAD
jgi:hypothetical protein